MGTLTNILARHSRLRIRGQRRRSQVLLRRIANRCHSRDVRRPVDRLMHLTINAHGPTAMLMLTGLSFHSPEFVLRVFRADPTPPTPPSEALLRPPAIEKNFLISPPGSPPIGWEQVVEDPPNVTPLADDLIAALRKLQLDAGVAVGGGREMILDPEDGAGIGVYVEDCDMEGLDVDEGERDWVYGEDNPSRIANQYIPTSRPPMSL